MSHWILKRKKQENKIQPNAIYRKHTLDSKIQTPWRTWEAQSVVRLILDSARFDLMDMGSSPGNTSQGELQTQHNAS